MLLKGLGKTSVRFNSDSRPQGRDLNVGLQEYDVEMLPSQIATFGQCHFVYWCVSTCFVQYVNFYFVCSF